MPKPMDEWKRASSIVRDKHEDPILVLFRIRNNRVDYSIANRPEPTLSGITDAVLMSALIDAGRSFGFKRVPAVADGSKTQRVDGRTVVYKESVEIDWHAQTIESSRGKALTLQVLSIVVDNLAKSAVEQSASKQEHGPN